MAQTVVRLAGLLQQVTTHRPWDFTSPATQTLQSPTHHVINTNFERVFAPSTLPCRDQGAHEISVRPTSPYTPLRG